MVSNVSFLHTFHTANLFLEIFMNFSAIALFITRNTLELQIILH